MRSWMWTAALAPIWVLIISCLLKIRKVFTLMEKHYEKENKKMNPKMFPVHWEQLSREEKTAWETLGCPREVPWTLLAPHEMWAHRNHSQSLHTLASRGGLSPSEMMAIIREVKFRSLNMTDREAIPHLIALVLAELP